MVCVCVGVEETETESVSIREIELESEWKKKTNWYVFCRDMQSYVSRLFLLMANESLKLVLFVDNEPWTTKENLSKPAELWQLMLTQVLFYSPQFI